MPHHRPCLRTLALTALLCAILPRPAFAAAPSVAASKVPGARAVVGLEMSGAVRAAASAASPALPDAPSGVAAQPEDGAIVVAWEPTVTSGAPVRYYVVAAEPGGVEVVTTTTNARIEPLVNGVQYTVTVSAWSAAGPGPASAPITATPRTVPDAPSALVGTPGNASVTLSWTAPATDGGAPVQLYVVTVMPESGLSWTLSTASTSVEVTGLLNREPYRFSVSAVNEAGAGPSIETGPIVPRAPASALLSSVWIDPATPVVADGLRSVLVTVVVRDEEGFVLAGQAVSVKASGSGNTLLQASGTTDSEGIVTATLASTVAQEKALTVTVNEQFDVVGAPTVTFVPGPATRLLLLQAAPAYGVAGTPFAPPIRIAVVDARGNAVTGPVVTLSPRTAPPAAGALLGALSVTASPAGATFDDVRAEVAGSYSLQAAVDGLTPLACGTTLVRPAPPTTLTMDVQPTAIRAREGFSPKVTVSFRDPFGNVSHPGRVAVTAGLVAAVGVGELTNPYPAYPANGVATLQYQSVDEPGTYSLIASAPGFAAVTSAPFTVTNSWELVSPEGGEVTSAAVAADGSVVYALTSAGLMAGRAWRSLDGGVTWERASAGLPHRVLHVATDPGRPARAYIAALDWGLYVTENGGLRWRRLALFRSEAVAVGPDGTLLVKDAERVRRSTDGGATWAAAVTLPSTVSCFAFEPSNAATVHAGTWTSGVLRSTDGGATWSAAGDLAAAGYVHRLAIDPDRPGTVWAGTDRGLYVSADAGGTWTLRGSGASQWTDVAFDPSVRGRMYATRNGSLQRTDDGGATWGWEGLSLVSSVYPVPGASGRPGAILADATYDYRGLFRREEGGEWTRTVSGLRGSFPLIAVHPTDPSVVIAARQGVKRSTDGGLTWSESTGVPDGLESFVNMQFDPFEPSTVLATTPQGVLYRSGDGGGTWAAAGKASWPLLFDRARPGTVFASDSNTILVRSDDGGRSWSPSNVGWPLASGTIGLLVQDPVDPMAFIASTSSAGLLRSTDGGASWSAMGSPSLTVSAISIDPRDSRAIVAIDSTGVWLTSDGGASWQAVTTPAPLARGQLGRDPWNPDVLLAGWMERLYRSDDAGRTWTSADSGYLAGSSLYQVRFAAPGVVYVSSSTGVYRSSTGGR